MALSFSAGAETEGGSEVKYAQLNQDALDFASKIHQVEACAIKFPNYSGNATKFWPDPLWGPNFETTFWFTSDPQATLLKCTDHPQIIAKLTHVSDEDLNGVVQLLMKEFPKHKFGAPAGIQAVQSENLVFVTVLEADTMKVKNIIKSFGLDSLVKIKSVHRIQNGPSGLTLIDRNYQSKAIKPNGKVACPDGTTRSHGVCLIDTSEPFSELCIFKK